MSATERGRRSDSLYYDNVSRRELCDKVAFLESDLREERKKVAELRRQVEQNWKERANEHHKRVSRVDGE